MNVVAEMLFNEPAPLAIWATLILLTMPALLVLGSPHGVHRPGRALQDIVDLIKARGLRRQEQRRQAVQADRWAHEVRAAADRAGHAADLWQERWEQAEQNRQAAFDTMLEADARLRRTRSAAAFGTPWTPRTPTEYAARERFLHQAVRAAAGRGELPMSAVADVLAGRGDWDATLHPVDQELAVHRAVVAHLTEAHQLATVAEQAAWHDAQLAARGRDSLRQEAAGAAVEAAALHHLLPVAPVAARTSRRTAVAARTA